MKKFGLLMVAVALMGFMASCGEDTVVDDTPAVQGTVWNLIDTKMPTVPDWVYGNAWYESTWDGENVVLILVEGQAPVLDNAERAAELERIATLARAIKELSTAKLGAATEGLLNDDEAPETYFSETIAAVSQNVNTSGSRPVGNYWLHGEYISPDGEVEEVYRYYELFALNAAQLQAAMDAAWEGTKKDYPEELVEEVDDTMSSLMDASTEMTAD